MKMESLPTSIQELDPTQARLCLEIQKYGNIKSGTDFASSAMLVGVSGGIDSMALLIISTLLARKSGGRVFCAHVDHCLRPESAGDSLFVQNICKELGVGFHALQADVSGYAESHSVGIEEAGRKIRYEFFNQCLNKLNADFLLLAHHSGDLCEDVVMRLIRGAGWPALGGMDAFDPARKLLRPLLPTRKVQLEKFLNSIACSWREDESNLSEQYTRNRIRNKIIPLLLKENPNMETGILRLKTQAELDNEFWSHEIDAALKSIKRLEDGSFFVPCTILNKAHPALRLRIYKHLLDSLGFGHVLSDSIYLLDQGFSSKKSGATFQFPGNKVVKVAKNGLLFKLIKTIDRESGKV